ncbi:MAG: ribonuclease III [Candidatus Poribacteria bacterium]
MCEETPEIQPEIQQNTDSSEYKDHLTIDEQRFEELYTLEYKIKYIFNDINLLDHALTHKSAITLNDKYSRCNERMEYLGDAVLELVVSTLLYKEFPEYSEGQLSKLKAVTVSKPILSACAKELKLGDFIRFGFGESSTGGKDRASNLANAFEALIASIYLDGGLEPASDFIIRNLKSRIFELDKDEMKRDYKSALQEYWQSVSRKSPVYRIINQTGPDHDKRFEVEVILSGESYGIGTGKNKKEAEQKAAEKALEKIFNKRRENDNS